MHDAQKNVAFYSVVAGLLALFMVGSIGCPTVQVTPEDPDPGTPVGTPPPVTLGMEVPETLLEEILRDLHKCTAKTFGPFHEQPGDSTSPTFSVTFHVTEVGAEGIEVKCSTDGGTTFSSSFTLLEDGDAAATGCTTPSGHPIFVRLN